MLGTSWKTSLMGWIIIVGDVLAFVIDVIQKQGLPDTIAEWFMFAMGLATGIAAILAKDRDVTGLPKAVPVILLVLLSTVGLTACATYHDAGNGRYNVTKTTEEPSLFGTNMGFARIENCLRAKPDYYPAVFTDCNPVTQWVPMYSQGQGGQILGGALTGLGAGIGGAMVDTGSTVIQSVTTPGGKGGHK